MMVENLHVMHKASFLDDDFMLATFDYEDYLNSQSNIMQLISNKPILDTHKNKIIQ